MGSLCHYISTADPRHYQPANIAFDLLPPLLEEEHVRDKKARRARQCRRALAALNPWLQEVKRRNPIPA